MTHLEYTSRYTFKKQLPYLLLSAVVGVLSVALLIRVFGVDYVEGLVFVTTQIVFDVGLIFFALAVWLVQRAFRTVHITPSGIAMRTRFSTRVIPREKVLRCYEAKRRILRDGGEDKPINEVVVELNGNPNRITFADTDWTAYNRLRTDAFKLLQSRRKALTRIKKAER